MNNAKKVKKLVKTMLVYLILILITNVMYAIYLIVFIHSYWALLGLTCSACFSIVTAKFVKIINYVLEDYEKQDGTDWWTMRIN